MSGAAERDRGSRRAELARARQSRRPSRLDRQAGATTTPDRVLDPAAGFPGLLARVWKEAASAADVETAVTILLTLAGHVPADVQLRALRPTERSALAVLRGLSRKTDETHGTPTTFEITADPAFVGELGLTVTGRLAVGVPGACPLAEQNDLVGGVLRIPWTATEVAAYQELLRSGTAEYLTSIIDCRTWLETIGRQGRNDILDEVTDAARRTAPFVLYQDAKLYTNFRERNNLTGKTLFPGHPDCVLSALRDAPLAEWSANDALLVVCLNLLIRSGSYARIEEANGTQLTLQHVSELLDRTRRTYNSASPGDPIPAAEDNRVATLQALADRLRARRGELAGSVQLYREIYGPLMHKIERIAGPVDTPAREREADLCTRLRERLPLSGTTVEDLSAHLHDNPSWLIEPHEEFGTGLEALIYETVVAARDCFDADFAMSRGLRSLSRLISALRAEDWATIVGWELPEYFCCVVPDPHARRFFGDTAARLADIAWSMSARMQYNSWHFLAGNLPKVPVVINRDYFVPPTIPDIAYFSDQHHHGHVAARVRFSIRSPQPVNIDGKRFGGFIDLRLLRCESNPFTEQDLLAAHRTSSFIAAATSEAARLAVDHDVTVTAFDPSWHWATITAAAAPKG
ncbi:hypothetical protein [Nocardia pneumoniae]|uniref:hypothetical protein n=1 Tax=Nocardia pneumoniae TaxID=228601 RepID=UPI00030E5B4E|nr:hypothetical protein [Nocardia pneumoniae]